MTKTNSNSGDNRKTGKTSKAKSSNQWSKAGASQKTPGKTAKGKSKTATITPTATATKPATIESMFGNQFAALAKEEEKQEALEEQKEREEMAQKKAEEEAKKLRGGKKLSHAEVASDDEAADDSASMFSGASIEELMDSSESEYDEKETKKKKKKLQQKKKKLGKKTKKEKKKAEKEETTTKGDDGAKDKPMTEAELKDMSFDDLHDLAKGHLRNRGATGRKGGAPSEPTAEDAAEMTDRMHNQKMMMLVLNSKIDAMLADKTTARSEDETNWLQSRRSQVGKRIATIDQWAKARGVDLKAKMIVEGGTIGGESEDDDDEEEGCRHANRKVRKLRYSMLDRTTR